MRVRGLSLLVAVVLAASFNTQAAATKAAALGVVVTPNSGATFAISSVGNTFVYRKLLGLPVNAKITCLGAQKDSGSLFVYPGLPLIPYNHAYLYGSATAGGKTYLFLLSGLAPGPSTNVVAVTGFGVSISQATTSDFCGAANVPLDLAVGTMRIA